MTESRSLNLAVIAGDGIGPEVVAQAERVLQCVAEVEGFTLQTTDYSLGADHWLSTGETLTDQTLQQLKTHDAILFGAVGADPRSTQVPSGLVEREILLKLRFALDHFINLRPSKLFPGAESPLKNPGDIDFVVVREGTEGPYAGNGGVMRQGTDAEIATEVSVNTAYGVRRLIRYAFELGNSRERQNITLIHKTNVLTNAGQLYSRIFNEIAAEYPQVSTEYCHIDAATIYLTTDPARFDVIVTDNLFGDIITDQAGAITGGIGLAACGNINATGEFPSMFEPVHGSAPDIAGQNIADPTASILSAAMLLRHLNIESGAVRIEQAVEKFLQNQAEQKLNTEQIGSAIVDLIKTQSA